MDLLNIFRKLFCNHNWKEIYCDIDGWCELHYWYKCKKCEKDKVQ